MKISDTESIFIATHVLMHYFRAPRGCTTKEPGRRNHCWWCVELTSADFVLFAGICFTLRKAVSFPTACDGFSFSSTHHHQIAKSPSFLLPAMPLFSENDLSLQTNVLFRK